MCVVSDETTTTAVGLVCMSSRNRVVAIIYQVTYNAESSSEVLELPYNASSIYFCVLS